ncbi:T9SS type A sorting domain-containing protein [bacterium]|nr:T9SS type A sorting domain-containing protein [bacterium]
MELSGFGGSGYHPVPADYDGDGKADLSVKSDGGYWFFDNAGYEENYIAKHPAIDSGENDQEQISYLPSEISMTAHPNPFNPTTNISYKLPEDTFVIMRVYDILGKTVRCLVNEHQQAGRYSSTWDGTNNSGDKCPTGAYLCQMITCQNVESVKLQLLK